MLATVNKIQQISAIDTNYWIVKTSYIQGFRCTDSQTLSRSARKDQGDYFARIGGAWNPKKKRKHIKRLGFKHNLNKSRSNEISWILSLIKLENGFIAIYTAIDAVDCKEIFWMENINLCITG